MPESAFGPIVPGWVVEDTIAAQLKRWFAKYLAELARQWVDDPLPAPKSWPIRSESVKRTEDQLPAVLVVSPGTEGEPRVEGDGQYEVDFTIGVVVFITAKKESNVRRNASMYAAAVRSILLQQDDWDALVTGIPDIIIEDVKWKLESYDEGPIEASRSYGAAIVEFTVTVAGVLNRVKGPTTLDQINQGPTVLTPKLVVSKLP